MRELTSQSFIGRLEIYEYDDGLIGIVEAGRQEVLIRPTEVPLFLEWAAQSNRN